MRRLVLFAVLLLFGLGATAQNTSKLTEEMQKQLNERTASDEQFRIIIVMAEQYDQAKMTRSTQMMDMEQRRAYVINELVNFSKASQSDLMLTLTEGKKDGSVEDLKSFWIFNGVSCVTTREMIYALSERKDIAHIESDEMRNMLPESNLNKNGEIIQVQNALQTPQTNRDGAKSIAWNVTQVHADQVWSQYNINGSGVLVAVIDTGLDYFHPDIISHIWQPTVSSITVGETTYNLGTFTYQGTTYKLPGYDFVNNDNDPLDDNGHGSHCAGTVAGNGTSGIQTGMAPGTTIMSLKVLSAAGSGSTSAITSAMEFAIAAGADAVSMSLGGHGLVNNATSLSTTERAAMVNMLNAGVVALVAAGNEGEYYSNDHSQPSSLTGGSSLTYYTVPWNIGNAGNCPSPWRHPDQTLDGGHTAVITIGASNRNDRKATFSSFGPCTWKGGTDISSNGYDDYEYKEGDATKIGLIKPDIIVPGTDITSMYYKYNNSTYIGQNNYNNDTIYFAECGTSMATPGAAGITALIIQAYKAKNGVKPTPAQIDSILEVTALPVDFRDTKNNTTGAGRADAKAAIDAIYTNATKPGTFQITNLTDGVVDNGGCVYLSWAASTSAPGGYAIYRDNEQVGTTMETSYVEKDPGVGKHTYYVRAIDAAGIQSVRSNAAFCTVMPYAYADNASITYNGTTATLGWMPTSSNFLANGDLKYIDVMSTTSAFTGRKGSTAFWGMCFNPEDLRPYQGMSITSVKLAVYKSTLLGLTDEKITLNIYRGTKFGNTTETPVYSEDFTLEQTDQGWILETITLGTPYPLDDITQDLWITFSDFITGDFLGLAQEYPMAVGPYDGHSSNVLYMGSTGKSINPENDLCWSHIPDFGDAYNYALSFEAQLTRTTNYSDSYDLAFNGTNLGTATNVPSTGGSQQYTPTLVSGVNTYTITPKLVGTQGNTTVSTNYSCPLEAKIVKVDSDLTETNLNIDQTKVYLVQSNGKLIADNLTCSDPSRLIIEDGGQLVAGSTASGTMKKEVKSYNATGSNGWYFIASPMVGNTSLSSVNNLISNDASLFYYDEPTHYWRNYNDHSSEFTTLSNGQGYLYGNQSNITLELTGSFQPSGTSVTLSDLSYTESNNPIPGWHLVGNPFPCQTTINRSYYTINGRTLTAATSGTIDPCTGVMVKVSADDNDNDVIFTRATESSNAQSQQIAMTVAHNATNRGDEAIVEDNAILSFNEGTALEKFVFNADNAKLYIPQNDMEYAIAVSDMQGETPINFKAAENGRYTLNFTIENVELGYLHLIDNLTGNDVDLLETPSYTFNASTTDYESRFRLLFDADSQENDHDTFAFISNGQIIIIGAEENTIAQVIDMTGRIIDARIVGSSQNGISTAKMNPAVYVLRLINGDNVKTQKIVVN